MEKLQCPLCRSEKLTRYDAEEKDYELITCETCKMIWKKMLKGHWIDPVTNREHGDTILEA